MKLLFFYSTLLYLLILQTQGNVGDATANAPSDVPTNVPSDAPTNVPSDAPTNVPSDAPTNAPTCPSNVGSNCPYGCVYNGEICVECGLTDFEPNVKIVGGIEAVPNSWPAQVLVFQILEGTYNYTDYDGSNVTETIDRQYMCGGTLINSQTVLTAAHCIKKTVSFGSIEVPIQYTPKTPTFGSTFRVYFGVHNQYSVSNLDSPTNGVILGAVKDVITHPDYSESNMQNDIALLNLKEPIPTTKMIKPACLPKEVSNSYPSINTKVYAAGWGTEWEGAFWTPLTLQNVALTTYDQSNCSNVYPDIPKNWNGQVCAGNYLGGEDTCQGDSGGGLVTRDVLAGKKRVEVIGVVSYGYGCAREGYPGIYTRVSYYLDWIKENWKVPEYIATTPATTTERTSTTKKTTTKKTTTRKITTKKPTTKKPTTRKPTTRKPTTRKPTTRKPTTRKQTTKKN